MHTDAPNVLDDRADPGHRGHVSDGSLFDSLSFLDTADW